MSIWYNIINYFTFCWFDWVFIVCFNYCKGLVEKIKTKADLVGIFINVISKSNIGVFLCIHQAFDNSQFGKNTGFITELIITLIAIACIIVLLVFCNIHKIQIINLEKNDCYIFCELIDIRSFEKSCAKSKLEIKAKSKIVVDAKGTTSYFLGLTFLGIF